jgi:hypothetical protein
MLRLGESFMLDSILDFAPRRAGQTKPIAGRVRRQRALAIRCAPCGATSAPSATIATHGRTMVCLKPMNKWRALAEDAAAALILLLVSAARTVGVVAVVAGIIAFSPSLRLAFAAEPHAGRPVEVFVATKGSLPGFNDTDNLPGYFAAAMNAVASTGWHFAPLPAGLGQSPERVELSFRTNPYAAGTVRTYGVSRATMDRLLNVHHSITIEARLFLGGQYQTLFFEQVTVSGGPHDADLEEAVKKLTRALTAYPTLNTHPDRSGYLVERDRSRTS